MIGNDVVDLRQSREESNWQRRGFQEKLFTQEEQLLIATYADPEIMVWILWSMKEAAYKILNRQTKIREYIPTKLVCTLLQLNSHSAIGQVACGENNYPTKTSWSADFIHSIAVTDLKDLNQVMEIERKDIFKDENGIPYLVVPEQNCRKEVSISNHGRFEKVVIYSDSNTVSPLLCAITNII